MKQQDREHLIISAASAIHEAWCEGELKAFYDRFSAEWAKGITVGEAMRNACLKNGKPRNEFVVDTGWILGHETMVLEDLKSFEGFKRQVQTFGAYEIKRFVPRNLTEAEQRKMIGSDYKPETKEENILRPFTELSADSQKENLEAAINAIYVYEEYAKRGVSLEQFKSEEAKKAIGTLIHSAWMRRNVRTEANKHLFVPYEELDDWTKQQDLDVFDALIAEIEKEPSRYAVEREEGLPRLYPKDQELAVLDEKVSKKKRGWRE